MKMEQSTGRDTSEVHTPLALEATAHVPNPSSSHAHGSVHLRVDNNPSPVIVCALVAPGNPNPGPFGVQRQRRTFWTECPSCKKMNKYSIEFLNFRISCNHCREVFKALEVSRPRNHSATSNGGFIPLSGTTQQAGKSVPFSAPKKTPNVAPLRKKLRTGVYVTKGENLHGIFKELGKTTDMQPNKTRRQIQQEDPVRVPLEKRFTDYEIRMLLKFKGKAIMEKRIKETMSAEEF